MRTAVAVDLGGTAIKSARCDARGRLTNRREVPTPKGRSAILKTIIKEIEAHLPASAIGLGTPGLVDAQGRVMGGCPNIPGWSGTQIGKALRRRFRLTVRVGNDANLAALGECAYGAGKGAKSLVLVTLGTGIGSGIVLDGKLFPGGRSLGAEIGHATIDVHGRECGCGGRGCFERHASASAILQNYGKNSIRDVREVFKRARGGDRKAKRAVADGLEALGLGLAGIINTFNPEVLLLGGGMSRIPGVVSAASRIARKRAIPVCSRGVRIAAARLGNDAGLAGAGRLALSSMPTH